jgi:hypothetical protein
VKGRLSKSSSAIEDYGLLIGLTGLKTDLIGLGRRDEKEGRD